MKIPMNLTIDLGENFIECGECGTEYSISEYLETEIKYNIKNAVLSQISNDITDKIKDEIKNNVLSQVKSYTLGVLETELKTLKIREYRGDREIDATAYITARLIREIQDTDVTKMVKTTAENYVKSIKERYDIVFASTLIDKMLKANLLNDDRVATLLSDKVEQ